MKPNQCIAHTRQGNQCGRLAMTGTTVCYMHGGKSPQVQAKIARERAAAEATRAVAAQVALFGGRRDINPTEAILELVQWTAGEVEFWRAKVAAQAADDEKSLTWGRTKVDHNGSTYAAVPTIAYRMLTDASDRLAKYSAAALQAGVEERRVRLAEQQAGMLITVITRILDRLDLTPAQQERVPTIVPAELRAVTA